jgi:hypothetical protein
MLVCLYIYTPKHSCRIVLCQGGGMSGNPRLGSCAQVSGSHTSRMRPRADPLGAPAGIIEAQGRGPEPSSSYGHGEPRKISILICFYFYMFIHINIYTESSSARGACSEIPACKQGNGSLASRFASQGGSAGNARRDPGQSDCHWQGKRTKISMFMRLYA